MSGVLPAEISRLIDAALVSELTVVTASGRPVTYPLIPLYDGRRIYMTSSVLFSRKLEHIKANPKVSVALTDPVGVQAEPFARATILGRAKVIEDDPHEGWTHLLDLWKAKEPAIEGFVQKRFAMPLFFERSVISIEPVKTFYWEGGDTSRPPAVATMEFAG